LRELARLRDAVVDVDRAVPREEACWGDVRLLDACWRVVPRAAVWRALLLLRACCAVADCCCADLLAVVLVSSLRRAASAAGIAKARTMSASRILRMRTVFPLRAAFPCEDQSLRTRSTPAYL
jgi:hypothetical protein